MAQLQYQSTATFLDLIGASPSEILAWYLYNIFAIEAVMWLCIDVSKILEIVASRLSFQKESTFKEIL